MFHPLRWRNSHTAADTIRTRPVTASTRLRRPPALLDELENLGHGQTQIDARHIQRRVLTRGRLNHEHLTILALDTHFTYLRRLVQHGREVLARR